MLWCSLRLDVHASHFKLVKGITMSKKESDKSTALKLGLFMAGSVFGAVLYIFFAFPTS